MAATPQQTRSENGAGCMLCIDLGSSSVKARFVDALERAGFKTTTDGIRAIVRDIITDRLQYSDGILQSPGESCPN